MKDDEWTTLYRHWGRNNTLLYVGISLSAVGRLSDHKRDSEWYWEIEKVTCEHYETREEALEAETIAIQQENPKYNKQKKTKKKTDFEKYVKQSQLEAYSENLSEVLTQMQFEIDEEASLVSWLRQQLGKLQVKFEQLERETSIERDFNEKWLKDHNVHESTLKNIHWGTLKKEVETRLQVEAEMARTGKSASEILLND